MAAKESLNQDKSNKWQRRWSSCPDNKLIKIKPTLGELPSGFRNSRKEKVVLSRLRIGHTYFFSFTHFIICGGSEPIY